MISLLDPIEDGADFIRLLHHVGINRVAVLANENGLKVHRFTVSLYARGLNHNSPIAHDLYDLLRHWERQHPNHPPLPRPTP